LNNLLFLLMKEEVGKRLLHNEEHRNLYSSPCIDLVEDWCKTDWHLAACFLGLEGSSVSVPSQTNDITLLFSRLFFCE
jgi:hypothetical protein